MGLKIKSPATVYLGSAVDPGSGGGGGGGQDEDLSKYFVKVFDYDGTLLDYKRLNNGEKYKLPETTPQHEGLVFQAWSCTAPVVDGEVTIDDNNVLIGATYDTASGKDEFDIELSETTGRFVTINIGGERDWGDGTIDTNKTHTYTDYGKYTIKVETTSTYTQYAFGQSQSYHNKYCTAIRLHSDYSGAFSSSAYSFMFSYCDNLETITIRSLTIGYQYVFSANEKLKCIILPSNFSSIGYVGFLSSDGLLETVVVPNGITTLKAGLDHCWRLKNFVIPDTVTEIRDDFLTYFSGEEMIIPKNITSIGKNFLSSGAYFLKKFIIKATNLTNVGTGTFSFGNNYSLDIKDNERFDLCNINETVELFTYMMQIKKFVVPNKITKFGGLTNCYFVEEIEFHDDVTSIQGIKYNYEIKEIVFPKKLNKIVTNSLAYLYGCSVFDFTKCESVPDLETGCFTNIRDFAKIYVPWSLYRSWITNSSWSYMLQYIDTKNTATVNFVSSAVDFSSYIYGELVDNTNVTIKGDTINYVCYDNTNKVVFLSTDYSGIQENSTVDINVDFSNSNRIELSIGVNGLDVYFISSGVSFKATEDNGNYYINVIGTNKDVEYYIMGGDNYIDKRGTITTTGSDITESITLVPCTTQSYTRPNLTANGTIGGNSFAVSAKSRYTYYPAYHAVNGNSNYWVATVGNVEFRDYLLYFPSEIKISQMDLTFKDSSSSQPTDIKIQASFDGIVFEDITVSYSGGTTKTVILTNNKYFKYYKLLLKPSSISSEICGVNFGITALEKVASV